MKKIIIFMIVSVLVALVAFSDVVVWSSEKQADFMRKIGEDFTKDTGITVDVQQVNYEDIKSKFLNASQAGEGPDIIVGAHDWVGELVSNGLIEPLPISAIETNKFAESGLNAFTINGKLYGLPYAIESSAIIYNKDFYEELPTKIEDLIALAKENTDGSDLLGFVYDARNFYFSYGFISGFGGYVFDWTKKTGYDVTNIGLNNEGAIKGLSLINQFYTDGLIPQGADYGIMDSMFKEGTAGMIINGPWALKDYLKAGIDFGVLPLTKVDLGNGHHPIPFVGVQGLMINSRSDNKAIAKEFVINYLATAEGIYDFYLADPRLPARTDVADIIAKKGGPIPQEIVEAFFESAAGGEPMPNVKEMNVVWTPMGDAFKNTTTGTQTPTEALNDAVSLIKSSIGK